MISNSNANMRKGSSRLFRPKRILGDKSVPYLFLFPAMLGIFIFKLYPIIEALKESLFAPTFVGAGKKFIGLGNYTTLFLDPQFWNSVKVTLLMNVVINPLQVVLALLLALLLNLRLRGIGIFRSVHYVPIAVSVPIASVIWNVMLNQDQGIINSMLNALGLPQQPFLGSKDQALWSIVGIATWRGVGYWAIFLLAGLQEVPKNLYEAAAIDGANIWQRFRNVTYPLIKRPLIFVIVSDTIINFLMFAPMYLLTRGGPENSTNVLMYESYKSAFVYSDFGRASALVVILLSIVLLVIAAQFRLFKADH
ncbi:MAG: sugar ABC transporter permease [Candidatus Carbobacillus altaicus]|uniref:Sugar ABC transporter permease n=1 Tax=Candidatus Carbonibacillus altaicus TaxID=2163959 RepID=A0A2R6Y2N5_9BACL|nr:MAG: sugar ABC transporter permease [Candidatus Carbobacillus altaicus]